MENCRCRKKLRRQEKQTVAALLDSKLGALIVNCVVKNYEGGESHKDR